METHLGLVGSIANKVGTSEAAFRLLLTILAGYPIVVIYRLFIVNVNIVDFHHRFFALCGLLLCYFNYGLDTYHSLIAVVGTYILMRLLQKQPRQLVIINFIFHMSYLLIGYWFTESNNYDILWTMPHCVLVLRLIGFGFDVADGQRDRRELSKDQLETSLEVLPTFLELLAYAYFPSSFIVGPQYPMRRYKKFIKGDFRQFSGAVKSGIKRMLLGVLYLAIRQVGAIYLPDDYFLSDAYRNESFIMRLIYLGIWGKLSLYKYISCWLLTEGALISLGFSYAGKTATGEDDWSGCTNVKLLLLESGNTMGHYVQSFNVNTNNWVAQYIYKRLKFLNNRTISYAAALGFLAVWHGFHTGYYMSFFIEYMIVTTERQIESYYSKEILPKYGHILNESIPYKCLLFIALKSYNLIYMGWCLTPFIFLSFDRWLRVFSSVNYFGFIYIAIWWCIRYKLPKSTTTNTNNIANNTATTETPNDIKKTE